MEYSYFRLGLDFPEAQTQARVADTAEAGQLQLFSLKILVPSSKMGRLLLYYLST